MKDQLRDIVQPVVEAMGCELWGIESLPMGRHSRVRIFIESETGVDVEDCARVSRQVSSVLDVEDPVNGEYTLEVSSPGLDRRLFELHHYSAFVGSKIRIRLKRPYEGSRKYAGVLIAVEGDEIILRCHEEEILFPFEIIERANIVASLIRGS
jgi:ribosome maturation factor RimP